MIAGQWTDGCALCIDPFPGICVLSCVTIDTVFRLRLILQMSKLSDFQSFLGATRYLAGGYTFIPCPKEFKARAMNPVSGGVTVFLGSGT